MIVHLDEAAVALLETLPRVIGNPYIIVGKKEKSHLTDLQHPWRRIRKAAGLGEVRIHDLRHTFAFGGLLVGEGLAMIGKLLGHTQVQTTARYAHLPHDAVRLSIWARPILTPAKLSVERSKAELGSAVAENPKGTGFRWHHRICLARSPLYRLEQT